MTESERKSLERLLARLIDDQLSPAQIAELEQLLLSDSAARDQYRALVKMNALLAARLQGPEAVGLPPNLLSGVEAEVEAGDASSKPEPAKRQSRSGRSRRGNTTSHTSPLTLGFWRERPLRFGSLALALTLLMWAGFYFIVLKNVYRDDPSPAVLQSFVAKVISERDPVWAVGAEPLAVGELLDSEQAIELESGFLQLEFGRGAVVLLEGPVSFVVDNRGAGTLTKGRLTARDDRPEAVGVGFSISTPAAVVTDLGTEFGVEVGDDKATIVEVFKGLVEAMPRSTDLRVKPISRRLGAGHSARLPLGGVAFEDRDPYPGQFALEIPDENLRMLTDVSVSEVPHHAEYLIDGSGLDTSGSVRSWTHALPDSSGTSWSSSVAELPIELTFDLGAVFEVKTLWMWNFSHPVDFFSRNRSVQHVRVEVSEDGQVYQPRGEITLAASESHPNRGQRFALVGRMRYVRLIVLDSHHDKSQADYGSSEVGLGEVRFEGVPLDANEPRVVE